MARQDEAEFRGYFATSFWLLVACGIVVLLATLGIASLAARATDNAADERAVYGILMILGSALAVLFPGRAYTGLLAAHLRYDLVSTMQILCVLGRFPLVILAFGMGGRLLALATCFAALQFVEILGLAFFAHRVHAGLTARPRWFCASKAREIIGYGFHTLIAQIADLMRFKLSPVIVTSFLGVMTAGFYDFADKLNRIVGELSKALMSVLSPVFSRQEGRGDVEGMRRAYLFTTKIAAYAAMLFGGMMFLFGGAFLQRWVGTRFDYLEPVMQVLVVGTIFGAAQMPTVQFLFGTSRHKAYAWNNIAHGLLVLGLTLVLVRPLGLMGVALGSTIPTIAMKFFAIPIPACRALQIPLARFYVRDSLLPLLVPVPFLAACGWVTHDWIAPTYVRVLGLATTCCALFVPYILAVGFTREERVQLLTALRLRRASTSPAAAPASPPPATHRESLDGIVPPERPQAELAATSKNSCP